MEDKIKEILDKLKDTADTSFFAVCGSQEELDKLPKSITKILSIPSKDAKILLNYITNLQEKYEEADNDRHKLFEQKEKAIDRLNKNLDTSIEICNKRQEEIVRLNNIINELEKEIEWQLKKQIDIDKFAEEQGFLNYNPVRLMVEHFKDKLKELKEDK